MADNAFVAMDGPLSANRHPREAVMSERIASRESGTKAPNQHGDDAGLFEEAAMESKRLKAFLDAQQSSPMGVAPPSGQPDRLVMRTECDFGEPASGSSDDADFDSLESAEANERDTWPWDDDLDDAHAADSADSRAPIEPSTVPSDRWAKHDDSDAAVDPDFHEIDDHSATEDVVLLGGGEFDDATDDAAHIDDVLNEFALDRDDDDPIAATRDDSQDATLESVELHEDLTMGLTMGSPIATPKRIGSGQLIPSRLTWRPGDPFAMPPQRRSRPFQWDLMLTSASVTAGCGLVGLWLLRTLLA
jgi:hypothetical protein